MGEKEEETIDTATEDLDQQDAVEEDLPTELPDDPVELKKVAEAAISRLTQAQQREQQLQSERDRLEGSLEEQRTKATYWATDAERLRNELKNKVVPPAKADEKPNPDDDVEIADLVASGTKVSDLKRMFMRDAQKVAEEVADRKAAQITQTGNHARQIVNEYPDLTNNDSPLTKATIAEMEIVDREDPTLSDQAKFELATRRSAARLGIAPRTAGSKEKSEDVERTRRRNAQGGPAGKPPASKGAPIITDAHRAMARKMNGGQDMPDKLIIEALKLVKPNEARA